MKTEYRGLEKTRERWGDEFAEVLASWMDAKIEKCLEETREHTDPGQTVRVVDLDPARNLAQEAPAPMQEVLGEEIIVELINWIRERARKKIALEQE